MMKQYCFAILHLCCNKGVSLLSGVFDVGSFESKDGMDQSKWAIPRCRDLRLTKSLAKHERPRSKLQGVWLHNICLCLYALDVRQSADGSMVAECLAKALDKMKEICDAKQKPYPKRILLWDIWI